MLRLTTALRPAARLVAARAQPTLARNFAGATFLDKGDVEARVVQVVKDFDKVDAGKVTAASHFINDLGLDSLDAVEVVMAFEDEFVIEIPDNEAEKIQTCADAINFVAAHPQAK